MCSILSAQMKYLIEAIWIFRLVIQNDVTKETKLVGGISWKLRGSQTFKSKSYSLTDEYFTYYWFIDLGNSIEKNKYNIVVNFPNDNEMSFQF